jgi:hypothetical protein
MVSTELARTVLELPPEERLELARRLIESVVAPDSLNDAIQEGSAASKTWPPGASKD